MENFKGLILLNFLDLSYKQIVSCQDEIFFYLKNSTILKLSLNRLICEIYLNLSKFFNHFNF